MEDFQEKTGADGKNGAVLFGTGAGTSRPQSAAELAQFLNALPGGLLKCKNDADFTIMNINRGFLKIGRAHV